MKDFYKNNDKVFSEKIASHEFQFDSSAWDKMEQLLDDEDPRKAIAWRYPYMMIILGIFFIGITLLSPATDTIQLEESTTISKDIQINSTVNLVPPVESTIAVPTTRSKAIVPKVIYYTPLKPSTYTLSEKANIIMKARAKKSAKTNTFTIDNNQKITPAVIKSVPIETIKTYLKTLPTSPKKRENVQAFIEANSLLQPVKHHETIVADLPIGLEQIFLKKKKVKVGMQVGASVVLAKRSIADQGKLATAIGGFINFDIDSKNSIAVEANYKNGYSEGIIFASNNSRSGGSLSSTDNELMDENYVQKHGFTEVNNIERVHTVEIPVVYKRKLDRKNSLIAGIKPSLVKFKNSSSDDNSITSPGGFAFNKSDENLFYDFGLVGGIEHRISKNLSIDLRYNQGLLDISSIDEVKNTNSELAMTVKYTF